MPAARWKNEACRRHYLANKDKIVARARAFDAKTRTKIRVWLQEYLLTHPCVDCGEGDILVLEFDHRDPAKKRFAIGEVRSGNSYGLKSVIAEVEKCDVRCANCHRRKTFLQLGWSSRTPYSSPR